MELLKEIRDAEKKARENIEDAKKAAEIKIAEANDQAKIKLAEAKEESNKLRNEILDQARKDAETNIEALEKAYRDKLQGHKQIFDKNQDKVIKAVLDSILPQES